MVAVGTMVAYHRIKGFYVAAQMDRPSARVELGRLR
jgi:hypothetical protein